MGGSTKTFQRNTALNLEHRTLLISLLAEDLSDKKKQIEDDVVGQIGWNLDIIQVAIQFFSEEYNCIVLHSFSRIEMQC